MNDKVFEMANYASTQVEFYKWFYRDQGVIKNAQDFERLPLLSKRVIQDHFEDFLAQKYFYYPYNSRLQIHKTTGSTGEALKVYWDYKDEIRSSLGLWGIRRSEHGVTPMMKSVVFQSVNYVGNKIMQMEDIALSRDKRKLTLSKINLTEERISKYLAAIKSFSPDWLSLQPSIACLLAEYILETNVEFCLPSLRYIEVNGEMLLDSQRELIHSAFDIWPTNLYGANETNAIAIENREQHLILLEDNVYVEVLKDGCLVKDGQQGDIYVTTLSNRAMPLIRYEMGDVGTLLHDDTGRRYLDLRRGRNSEYILTKDGRKINIYTVVSAIEYTNEFMQSAICQFQIEQKSLEQISVKFVLRNEYRNWQEAVKEEFIHNLVETELGKYRWDIEFVNQLFPDQTGKVKVFIPLNV